MPRVRLSGTVNGVTDPNREVRALMLYHLFANGWDIYNSTGDQRISLINIEEKIKLNHAIFGRKGMSFEIQDIWEGERVSARSNLPIASKIPETKNIYCIGGLGSRGLSYAPFLAEIVSSAVQDKQIPLSKEIFSLLNI